MRDSDRVVLAACLAAAVMSLAACGGSSSGGGVTTSPSPTPQPKTETFNGTVAVRGCSANNFTTTADGEVDVTLTAAGPPSNVAMSLSLGTPIGGTCSLIQGPTTVSAGSSPQITGNATTGTYCVNVCDSGAQTGTVNYTVTVQHQ
jgi:hypothetical protein